MGSSVVRVRLIGLLALAFLVGLSGCDRRRKAGKDRKTPDAVTAPSSTPAPATEPASARPATPVPAPAVAPPAAAVAVAPAIDEPVAEPPNSKIKSVTVFSDRARVTRTTPVQFQAPSTVFEFKQLPGWVDDGSVRVAVSDGRIIDVAVRRDYLARSTDKSFRAAEEAVAELTTRAAALDDELKILEAQAQQIASIKAYSLQKLTKDITLHGGDVESYGKVVDFISASLRKTAQARRDAERQRRDVTPALAARQKKLEELRKLTQLEHTTVAVTLEGPVGKSATLDVTYMLPGATWEPAHELRSSGTDADSVEVTSYAVVTQTSGEDWENADISFSTQSSTDAVRIPELGALTLGKTHSTTRTVKRRISSYTRAETAFRAQNELWNMTRQSKSHHDFQRVYKGNYENLQVVQGKTVRIFKSLQERGTTALFNAQDRAKIRSDGNPVRLRIGRSELSAKRKIVAAPEQSMNAANTLRTTNTSSQPLLPGVVALYRDGAFLGNTDLDFVAQGEEFAVFLNVADHIKLSRTLDKKQSSLLRETRNRMQLVFVVEVENLSSEETALSLTDRVPVSQNKDIKIDRVKITPAAEPDSKGLLKWDVTLAPKEKQTFRIGYRIDYPPFLMLTTEDANEDMAPSPSVAPAFGSAVAPPAAAPPQFQAPKRRELKRQIRDLEQKF